MRAIWDFFKSDRFAQQSRLELLKSGTGRAQARMTITDAHRNGVDQAHGGAIFTLAGLMFAASVNSRGTATMETSRHPQPATDSIKATDEATEMIAPFKGMVYPQKDQIGPPAP